MGNTTNKITKNGDRIFWSPEICNTGGEDCLGTYGKLIIPPGLKLICRGKNKKSTPTYDKGIFNQTENEWHIGTLEAGNCYQINFEFEVTDIDLADFIIQFQACSSCTEDISDNTISLTITKGEECEFLNLKIGPSIGTTVKSGSNLKIG